MSKKMISYGWFVCLLAAVFYCYEYLLRIVPSVMISDLMRHFAITSTGFGYLSASYLLGYAPLQLFVGVIIDRFGSRLTLIMALLLCILGSFLFAFTDQLYVACLARFIVGVGSAFAFVGVLRLASSWLLAEHFPFFVGIATALGMIGALFGQRDMSHWVGQVGWSQVVVVSAMIGCAIVPFFILFVREKRTVTAESLNTTETMMASLRAVLSNRHVLRAGFIGCVLFLSLSVFADVLGVSFIHAEEHIGVERSATINSMIYLGWLIGAPLVGYLSEYFNVRRVMLMISAFFAMLCFTFILYVPIASTTLLMALLFLFGLFCSVEVLCFALAKESVPEHQIATALGVVNCIIMMGGMVLLPLIGSCLDIVWHNTYEHGLRIYTSHDFHIVFIIIPILFVLALFCCCFVRETTAVDQGR